MSFDDVQQPFALFLGFCQCNFLRQVEVIPVYYAVPDQSIAAFCNLLIGLVSDQGQLDEIIQSKIMAMVFSMAAEVERGLISERTKEALRARRASGLPVGRSKGPGKSKLDKHRPEIEALLANGSTQKFIAKRYNSSPANLTNWLQKRGIKKPKL